MQIRSDNGLEIRVDFVQTQASHFHEALEILFLCGEGSMEVRTDSDSWVMNPEDIIVINSGIRHQILSYDQGSILCSLWIPRSLISRSIHQDLFLIVCNSVTDKNHHFGELRSIIKSLIKHCLMNKSADLYFLGKFYQFLYELTKHYLILHDDVRYKEKISKNEERTQQILSYLYDNYNRDISLNELAGKLYLTNAYLSRFFKKTFGVNFGEYVNMIKLHYAASDLLYSSKTITRIAMDNGFSNMASFNKSFKTVYHMTPKEYKENGGSSSGENEWETDQNRRSLEEQLQGYMEQIDNTDSTPEICAVADCTQKNENYPCKRPWQVLLNVGDMVSLKDYRIRSELLRINSSLKFTYARLWNVLSNDMLLGTYISDDPSDYDFSYLDECIDFLLQNGLKPFLQMGYKRVRDQERIRMDVRRFSVMSLFSFKSLDELIKVLRLTLKHLIVRYGQDELNTWRFEIWHPNISYYLPDIFFSGNEDIFSAKVYWEIRSLLPHGKIGGAEFSLLLDMDQNYNSMMRYKEEGIQFDFITCVSFPYKVSHEGGSMKREWQIDRHFMRNEMEALKQNLIKVGWGNCPVWVTEYSFTLEHRNILNDTRFKGAYILRNMMDVFDIVDAAGYWLLSDIYSEGGDSNRLLYGGSGLATKDCINKPVYFAFYFLSVMKPLFVEKNENYLLTTDGNGNYSLLCHNMKELNYLAFSKSEKDLTLEDMNKVFEDEKALRLKIILKNIGSGLYRLKCLKIDAAHGDIQTWVRENNTIMGLKRQEIWHLQQSCMPQIRIYCQKISGSQSLGIEEKIEANDFLYYEIERVL
ncbi:beta-xylosidase/AraC-like DNA-binding protein [Catenibacillus scindens]|uniref:Beta-xylosidase/AraC-like DNA-binding protein n=1 Tax=Catenibacillus scindens TaxID=673271 RepID=A0A7W8HBD7_9FIRM|nr:helix-turn-helix domain-containing protein [Catenibacillus scindens]MBB5264635.1 beta-xylosidase/AraC-like DNA-binding protein [Catenibacillus scindens]